jgi:IS30 family transposase
MSKHLSPAQRGEIIGLSKEKITQREIAEILNVSKSTVRYVLKKPPASGSL